MVTGSFLMELEFPAVVNNGISTDPEVRWWYVCNVEEVERMGSIAVRYLMQCTSPRPYTLECTQQALVSGTCTLLFNYSHNSVVLKFTCNKQYMQSPKLVVLYMYGHFSITKRENNTACTCATISRAFLLAHVILTTISVPSTTHNQMLIALEPQGCVYAWCTTLHMYHVTPAISVYWYEACCSITARLAQTLPQLTIDTHKNWFICLFVTAPIDLWNKLAMHSIGYL